MGSYYCPTCEANGCIACDMIGIIEDPAEAVYIPASIAHPASLGNIEPSENQALRDSIDPMTEGVKAYEIAIGVYSRMMMVRHPICTPRYNCTHKWAWRRNITETAYLDIRGGIKQRTGPLSWWACVWCGKWETKAEGPAKPEQSNPTPKRGEA